MRERDVYEIWSHDKSAVYVGLSVSAKKRAGQHRYDKTAGGLLDNGGKMCVVRSGVPEPDAVSLERELIAKYRTATGVKCLNRRAGGQLGSNGGLRWTKDVVREIARGCKTRSEFYYKNGSAYQAARRDGYFEELCDEFGFSQSLHKAERVSRDSLFRKFNNCSSFFDIDEYERNVIIRRGLWKEFSGVDVVRSDNIPDDFAKRLKYFPKERDTVNLPWSEFLFHYEDAPFNPDNYMNSIRYFGEYDDTLRKIKVELTRDCCRKAGIMWIDCEPVAPRYATVNVALQKNFPEGHSTIELMIRYPGRWSLRPNFWGNGEKIHRFMRDNSQPKTIENAIAQGKLPVPTLCHDTGALFPIESVIKWALDTPRTA